MRFRVLAAAAVAAWSKTAAATTATVLPGVLDQTAEASVSSSAPAATTCTGFTVLGPNLGGTPQQVSVTTFKGSAPAACVPGTASLQASIDQTQWKTLDSQHTSGWILVSHTCLPGTWSYRGFYVTDDHAFKGTITPQEQFTC